jgi:dihydropteroate synthase
MRYYERMSEFVGIVNITPDSFSGDGHNLAVAEALAHVERVYAEGAIMADIGAESTRPGAEPLTAEQEWQRLEPVLTQLPPDRIVSIDTYHPETIEKAVKILGTIVVNDVSGLYNPRMPEVVAEHGLHCIVGHLPKEAHGSPAFAHKVTPITSMLQVRDELFARRDELISQGIAASKIILDPGIGFAKTPALNLELPLFPLIVPDIIFVMVGYSQKKSLGEHRYDIERNLEAGQLAVQAGAAYIRVHEVAPHVARFRNY